MSEAIKFLLPDDRIPKAWYNLVADLPRPLPPVSIQQPANRSVQKTLRRSFRCRLSCKKFRPSVRSRSRIRCAMSTNYGVRRRCGALGRSNACSIRLRASSTKHESAAPTGSFKPNEAVAEAFYIREAGAKKIITGTGAGQWGSAIAFAGARFDLEVKIFMVKLSNEQKPHCRTLMETYGATCILSPSTETEAGRRVLAADPNSPGSIAIVASRLRTCRQGPGSAPWDAEFAQLPDSASHRDRARGG